MDYHWYLFLFQVPVPDDLDEKKHHEADGCSGSNASQQDVNDVSMPICFLVKEQAKSLIAIQVEPFFFSLKGYFKLF